MRTFALWGISVVLTTLGGCRFENNPIATRSEADSLRDITPLTSGFEKAGEAYFSRDMKWIIFQAVPQGQEQYQMYVAPVKQNEQGIAGIGQPIRISPENSRNTCGYFSPDGNTVIFASTAGKEDPSEPTSGYQREGQDYRWSYPSGMEIYRADGWQGAIAAAEPGKITDLAKHRLTDNSAYDAECAFSPDGKWIIFTSNRDGDLELYAMRSDGTNVVRLTNTPGYDGGAFFSPDGKHIVFRSDRKKKDYLQIYTADIVFDAGGAVIGISNEKPLTIDLNTVNWGPFWHPDGEHILYGTSAQGHDNYELYLMRSDGTRKTRITFANGADVLPAFSPDGKYLLWASKRNGKTTQVYLARFQLPPGV
jgi:Tol biopolymer transport system component